MQYISSLHENVHEDVVLTLPDGRFAIIMAVHELECLGSLLDRKGSSRVSAEHRQLKASKLMGVYHKILTCKLAAWTKKIGAWGVGPSTSACYGARGWHLTSELFHSCKAWKNLKINKILRLRRDPDEDNMNYNIRTSLKIQSCFKREDAAQLHHKVLRDYHSWAWSWTHTRCEDGTYILRDVMEVHQIEDWSYLQASIQQLDPTNIEKLKRRIGGVRTPWET